MVSFQIQLTLDWVILNNIIMWARDKESKSALWWGYTPWHGGIICVDTKLEKPRAYRFDVENGIIYFLGPKLDTNDNECICKICKESDIIFPLDDELRDFMAEMETEMTGMINHKFYKELNNPTEKALYLNETLGKMATSRGYIPK